MKILNFIEKDTNTGKRFERAMKSTPLDAEYTIVRTFTDLNNQMRRSPLPKPSIIVLLVENFRKLRKLFDMRSLFQGIRIILILPDDDRQTLALGHRFHPRYVSYMDSDFSDVRMVLEKMIRTTVIKRGMG
jgi:hypothetical protein